MSEHMEFKHVSLRRERLETGTAAAVPKSIHQTWKHEHIRWPLSVCSDSFRKWNPSWDYKLWTDEECEQLVRSELPDFYPTYMGYPAGIFRADIFRVAVLYLRGGVYADLDVECLRPLDELLEATNGDGDWEVLLARDHPAHERHHWSGRAMWMNAFMIAKPRARFFKLVLDRYTKNLFQKHVIHDAVTQTGPGLFSMVVESCCSGITGLGIRALPWRWVHPLPNLFLPIQERSQYKWLVRHKTWRDGQQISMGDDDEGDPTKGGPPFVAHYWWHSYIEHCAEKNMMVKYARMLLQTDGEIVERRLQKWVPTFGESLDATGQALAVLAERGSGVCRIVGEPAITSGATTILLEDLAREVLEGLPVKVGGRLAAEPPSESADEQGDCSLLALAAPDRVENAAEWFRQWSSHVRLTRDAHVLLLGGTESSRSAIDVYLEQKGFVPECSEGGSLWRSPVLVDSRIPKVIHTFSSEAHLTRAQMMIVTQSWSDLHLRNWTIKTWTPESIRKYIAAVQPGFLDAFLGYPDEITRWGAARYFILQKEGGVALSVQSFCIRNFPEDLLGHDAVFARADAGGGCPLSDDVIASKAGHEFWRNIAEDLTRNAKGGYDGMVGKKFLWERLQACSRFLSVGEIPVVVDAGVFDVPGPLTRERLRKDLRRAVAVMWTRLPLSVRERQLASLPVSDAQDGFGIVKLVQETARVTGWVKYCPVFERSNAERDGNGVSPKDPIDETNFRIADVINARTTEMMFATSLFWEHLEPGRNALPVPTMDLIQNAKKLGGFEHIDPWESCVLPVIRTAEKYAAERPELSIRVYLSKDLDFLVPLLAKHCEVVLMADSSCGAMSGAIWRFLALEDGFDLVHIVEPDMLASKSAWVLEKTPLLFKHGVMSWRQVCDPGFPAFERNGERLDYLPIHFGGVFGSRIRVPTRRLLQAFASEIGGEKEARSYFPPSQATKQWSAGRAVPITDESWFACTTIYPRLLTRGFLTFGPNPKSQAAIADTMLNAMTNPNSRRFAQ